MENHTLQTIQSLLKKDTSPKFRTMSLFWELRRPEEEFRPPFTIKEFDHVVDGETYYSLKQIYLSYDHVPGNEYDFAIDVFGSWNWWKTLCESPLLRKMIKGWQDELEIKLRAKAIRNIASMSQGEDNKALTAAKYLADKGYVQKNTKGRPSKEEVERLKKQEASLSKEIEDDMARILKVAP